MLNTILNNWLIPAIAITVVLVAVSLFTPAWAGVVAGVLLFLILAMTIFAAARNQVRLYREKRISRAKMAWNILFEIMGILLAMMLAALLGKYLVGVVTEGISHSLIKFIAAIVISLLTGMGVGFLMRRIWDRQPNSAAKQG